MLAYFGFPRAREDDAERAVRAGLALFAALDEPNPRLARRSMPALALRVGIHTGNVAVGEVGGGDRREVHAIGEAMNVAARIQNAAGPTGLLGSRGIVWLAATGRNLRPGRRSTAPGRRARLPGRSR